MKKFEVGDKVKCIWATSKARVSLNSVYTIHGFNEEQRIISVIADDGLMAGYRIDGQSTLAEFEFLNQKFESEVKRLNGLGE